MANSHLAELGVSLREAMRHDRPAAAVFGVWRSLNDADPDWRELLDEITGAAGRLHPSVGASASIHPSALGMAVVDRHGRVRRLDQRFQDWLGDPGALPACVVLAARASRDGRSIGLVTAPDGRVVTVFAVSGELAAPWAGLAGALPPQCDFRDPVLLVAFAPSSCSALIERAAMAIGLSPLEARLAEALLDAPNLEVAAQSIGVGRETAKDALRSAMRKAGVNSASNFVGHIVNLSCEAQRTAGSDIDLLRLSMDLSPAEARIAAAIAKGGTAAQIGAELGLTTQTVKSYRRSIFLKTGVNRSRDLQRLMSEMGALDHLASASEVLVDHDQPHERLRVIVARGRRVACIDYGPASGAALIVGHGYSTGRLMPKPLLDRCQAAGYRVIIPQRPGFGLTDPAEEDYLETAADDLAAILDSLRLDTVRALARDGGVATVLAFAVRHPGRLDRPVLFNPRPPRGVRPPPLGPMSAISYMLLDHPGMIEPFAEMLRRQTRSDILDGVLRRACAAAEVDRVAIEAPGVLPHLLRDVHGLIARSVRGFIDEQRLYSLGWTPPAIADGSWTLAYSGAVWGEPDIQPWAGLPNARCVMLEGAGLLAGFTHPDAVVDLLGASRPP